MTKEEAIGTLANATNDTTKSAVINAAKTLGYVVRWNYQLGECKVYKHSRGMVNEDLIYYTSSLEDAAQTVLVMTYDQCKATLKRMGY